MAELSVTATSVLASVNAKKRKITAGATVTAGQVIYEDASDSMKGKLCDANGGGSAVKAAGIALGGASTGQPLWIVYEDPAFTPGGTLTTGNVYIAGATTPGAIADVGDLASTWYPNFLFNAISTTQANLKIINGTVAK